MVGWVPVHARAAQGRCYIGWQYRDVCVISTLDHAELPGGDGVVGPQWHVSISRVSVSGQKRAGATQVRLALRAFGMVGAEEDNHHPGLARHFWLPVDPAYRGVCECKAEEVVVVEPDGYTWQNDPLSCRGCEFHATHGHPCPIHAPMHR